MMSVVQMKLTSGDEVIAEVMDWPGENGKDLIIRNAMSLSYSYDEDMSQIYGLKPWMSMIENPLEYIVVNADHVVSTTKPNNSFLHEYTEALQQMHSIGLKRQIDYRDVIQDQEKRFKEKLEEVTRRLMTNDSDTQGTILQFPSPDTSIH